MAQPDIEFLHACGRLKSSRVYQDRHHVAGQATAGALLALLVVLRAARFALRAACSNTGRRTLLLYMKGMTTMKHLSTKLVVLFALLMTLTMVAGGTASAQTVTITHQTISTARTQSAIPANCGWVQRSNWEFNGVNIIKWNNTCTGSYHCQAIEDDYYGPFSILMNAYAVNGTLGAQTDSVGTPFWTPLTPPSSFNTASLSGWVSYTCVPADVPPIA